MDTVPILADGPRLEGVLGPLSASDERDPRLRVLAAGDLIGRLREALAGDSGSGQPRLNLCWYPSGQLVISGSVAGFDPSGNAVEFSVELRPGWFYRAPQEKPTWVVETSIHADCLHSVDHGVMHEVHSREVALRSADEAVVALSDAIEELIHLATSKPLDHWLAHSRD